MEEQVILIESRFKKFHTSQLWTHQEVQYQLLIHVLFHCLTLFTLHNYQMIPSLTSLKQFSQIMFVTSAMIFNKYIRISHMLQLLFIQILWQSFQLHHPNSTIFSTFVICPESLKDYARLHHLNSPNLYSFIRL